MSRLMLFSVFFLLSFYSQGQSLQTAYEGGRTIQTTHLAPVVIKAGQASHALQIWENPSGWGYLEFYNNEGGGPLRAIYGNESRLNYTSPAHSFIGNIGINQPSPGAKLSFNNVNDGSDGPDGITWYSPSPLAYGIHRTPGTWVAPNYQQLRLSWDTGIILDPGKLYNKSYVEVRGSGLRVSSGNVGIGIEFPDDKLAVNGNIRAKEIRIENGNWPDFVFSKSYKLPTLLDTEEYIKINGHLPDVPSAKEVTANGIDLGNMNAILLKKIEELTLYLIEQNKQIIQLKSEVIELKSKPF